MRTKSYLPNDTSAEAKRAHINILRRLGTAGRAKMAFDLSDGLRETLKAGIRFRHPDYNEGQVRLAALRLAIGDRLFKQAHPDIEIKG